MSKSERIRALGREGLSTRAIADAIGVKYQHAYQVLRTAGLLPMAEGATVERLVVERPMLTVTTLLDHGFEVEARWSLAGFGVLLLEPKPTQGPGVYAFALDGLIHYVGVATRCVAHRLGFYRRPNITQRTNVRLKAQLLKALEEREAIDILVARPGMSEWNGLPVNNCAGLELGLIQAYHLAWNQRT